MAEGGESEKSSLGKFVKNQTKYGTTTKATVTNETYLKHVLSRSDTLQGVALKYGVSMEQIKRANNLWTNDSLFLKEFLLIPLPHSPVQDNFKTVPQSNGAIPGTSSVDQHSHGDIITKQELMTANKLAKSKSHDALSSETSTKVPQQNNPSAKDFLSKFDSSLKLIRTNLQKLEETSEFPEDNSNPLNLLPTKRNAKYGYRSSGRSHSSEFESVQDVDPNSEPQLVFKSRNSMRRNKQIRTSLEKLEKQQDDMFQL